MKIRSVSRFCFLFVLALVLNAGSANATILTGLSGTEAHITNNVFDAIGTEVQCGDGSSLVFNYVQRMVINGKVEMVLTEYINDVGTYELTLLGECGGKNLYGLGTCACRPTAAAVNMETARAVMIVARVKWHTTFDGRLESGLMKMSRSVIDPHAVNVS